MGALSGVQADLVLAKYSCLALRRIGGSQKKVKGSLTDASVRLPMSSPIFDRLRYLIEMPTQNKDWFGMAEQAINTIFVLGEQPDYLASSILQTMTRRVFERKAAPSPPDISSPPIDQADVDDVGDCSSSHLPPSNTPETPTEPPASACELAQLIFAAGHCAIKQLIHLELVEREYKRRKAEADKSAAGDKATANDELDQVAGSVEDDVADAIIHAREDELLYGVHSILSVFAPMSAQICSQPKSYKVRSSPQLLKRASPSYTHRMRRSELPPCFPWPSSCVLAPNSAKLTSCFSSKSSRRRRIQSYEATL